MVQACLLSNKRGCFRIPLSGVDSPAISGKKQSRASFDLAGGGDAANSTDNHKVSCVISTPRTKQTNCFTFHTVSHPANVKP